MFRHLSKHRTGSERQQVPPISTIHEASLNANDDGEYLENADDCELAVRVYENGSAARQVNQVARDRVDDVHHEGDDGHALAPHEYVGARGFPKDADTLPMP